MEVIKRLVGSERYPVKCPYPMTPVGICVHNTSNDASAANEIAYMTNNSSATSFHYAIDDREIIQGIPDTRNAFHAGDGAFGDGNRKYIGIEICYSLSGGERFVKAEKNAAMFIAQKLKEYGWDISQVKKHQDFSGKYCPHRTLDMGWQRFLDMINAEMEDEKMTAAEKETFDKLTKRVEELEKLNKVYHYWDEIKALGGDIHAALYALYKAKYFFGKSPADLNISKDKLETLVVLARALKADGKLEY